METHHLAKHCQEWPAGKTESEIKFLIQENRKPPDIIVYTDGSVTKDQSGWGFTVKQGATIIRKEGGSGHPRWIISRGNSQTTHAVNFTDRKSLLKIAKSITGSPRWHVSMVHIHLRKLLCMYSLGDTEVKENDRADRLASKATTASVCFFSLEISEVLRNLRHCQHKAKDITFFLLSI